MKKTIYLIRHGRQASALCNVNVELSDEGRKQAELLATRLRLFPIHTIYSSHLIRAVETATILGKERNLTVTQMDGIEEIDFGALTGLTEEEIASQFPDFMANRAAMTSDLSFPSGENGEQVFMRAFPVIQKLANNEEKNIVVVTHGGVIRSLLTGILGLPQSKKLMFAKDLENTSITELLYDTESGLYSIERLNDATHLEGYPSLQRKAWKR